MAEFTPACITGNCPLTTSAQQESAINNTLCRSVFEIIKNVNGVGYLEVNRGCPLGALEDIATDPSDEGAELRDRLGIVAVYTGGDS